MANVPQLIRALNTKLDAMQWEKLPSLAGRTTWQRRKGDAVATITRGGRFARVSVGSGSTVWFKADYAASFPLADLKQIASSILEQ